MKNSYELSKGDIDAITAALAILPAYDFAKYQNPDALFAVCTSAGSKLINHKQLTEQELGVVAISIDSAYKALRNEITLNDENAKSQIRKFIFTYNKLLPLFSPFLDNE